MKSFALTPAGVARWQPTRGPITARVAACVLIALWLQFGSIAVGQAQTTAAGNRSLDSEVPAATAASAATTESAALLEILAAVGLTGTLILLVLLALSTMAVALAIEHLLTIRQKVFLPPGLGEQLRRHLAADELAAADEACAARPSFLAFVLRAGLAEVDGGWSAVEKAIEDAMAQHSARLFRKIEYLSAIGNIAPMIGLLGTVMGMIFAFQQVADTQGAAGAGRLAEGIYTALVTTVGGLLVAIPSLAAFAVFRNRIDQLVAEVAYVAHHVVAPLKRGLARRSRGAVPVQPAAGRGL